LWFKARTLTEIEAGRPLQPWETLLYVLQRFFEVWDDDRLVREATEYKILERDGWQCAAPGCSSRRSLEVHHIIPRARGGSDEPDNLITLCSVHHRGIVHQMRMRCEGDAPGGVIYTLGLRISAECEEPAYRGDVRMRPAADFDLNHDGPK
ncbi:MAG: HNH endonuclease, partial [Candidatus Eisenbacteria bacterium]|nr:HNH endonuclease [Candidatus Eisenbacteria bacterium]